MNKKSTVCLLFVLIIIVTLTGCSTPPTLSQNLDQQDLKMAENQQRLEKNQPAPQITFSNERANIIKRASTFGNDPNKVSYIYLLTDNGQVIAFYTVKGKVSNVSSYLVPDQNVVHGVAIQAPDIDGSYGTNGDGIFFYTTDNTYVEWSGQYLLCDQPLKISSPPVLTMEVKR